MKNKDFFKKIVKKTSKSSEDERAFLKEINKLLPKNVNWKKGAIEYLEYRLENEGQFIHKFHLLKPFCPGSDCKGFYVDMYKFLNVIQILNLPVGSAFLDVGCGPGWVSHYLCKLGYNSLGIDIANQFIDFSNKRLQSDISSFPGKFPADFIVHDIEQRPLDLDYLFDVAIFESSLHHFYDPISALKNVSKNLKDNGILVILESLAPDHDSEEHKKLLEVMTKYHTLERPYTKDQMIRLFQFTGFNNFKFLYPVSGFRELGMNDKKNYHRFYVDGPVFNYVFASKNGKMIENLGTDRSQTSDQDIYRAHILVKDFPKSLLANQVYTLDAKVMNVSNTSWHNYDYTESFSFNFSYHWLDSKGDVAVFDGLRTALPNVVNPRNEVILRTKIQTPDRPGNYTIEFDLVREYVTWFAEKGSKTLRINTRVKAENS
jgi:SAM-dependent methyltransferase